jgi:hypothetical protein
VSAVSNISSASTLTVSSRSSSSYQDLFGERVVFELQQIGKRLNTMENILLHKSSETVSEVNMFYLLGGDDPQKTVYLIMKKIFDKNLATSYSGQGKKHKHSFLDLKFLYNSVFCM